MTKLPSIRLRDMHLGTLLVPALVLALVGGAARTAQASATRHNAQHASALAVPSGSAVVTNCSTAGFMAPSGGQAGEGLGTALQNAAIITFACDPALSGAKVGGKYVITLPQGTNPGFEIPSGEAASIDGSDGGLNDVAIDGGLTLTGGKPTLGTGVQIFYVDTGASLSLANLTLQHGYANGGIIVGVESGYGGAVESFGNFTATNVTFSGNQASIFGGAVELDSTTSAGAQATISNSTFTGNAAAGCGGALNIGDVLETSFPQTVTISHSTFNTNSANQFCNGGAIHSNNGFPAMVAIDHSVFNSNTASAEGGAIHNYDDTFTVTDSLFLNNSALDGDVGGAFSESSRNGLTILRSSFIGNSTAGGDGGALYVEGGTTTNNIVANSTFSGNSAVDGGAIFVGRSGLSLTADTIAGNSVHAPTTLKSPSGAAVRPAQVGPTSGAGITNSRSTINVQSTIVSNNINLVAGPTTVVNCSGALTGGGFNLEFSGVGGTDTCGFVNGANGDITGKDPLLGTPADNGGPDIGAPGTVTGLQTLALGAGSPAIGGVTLASVCTSPPVSNVDNRSLPRHTLQRTPQGCDVGALDTGGNITNPFTVVGSFNYLGGFRLGIAASTNPAFPLNYITFQKGAGSFAVHRSVTVTCLNQCIGVTGNLIPGAAVSLTLAGTIFSGWGGYAPGTPVSVVLTLSTTARSPLGIAGQPSITASVSAVTVLVNGAQVATATAPFNRLSTLQFRLS